MNISDFLQDNCPVRNNQYTPIAYTVTALALCTHTHPVQALQYVFSNEDYLMRSSNYGASLDVVRDIIDEYALPLYGEIGDISEDYKLVGHMESLVSSLCIFLDSTRLSLADMNEIFASRQIWENMACTGRSWVSSGIDWTVDYLRELCS